MVVSSERATWVAGLQHRLPYYLAGTAGQLRLYATMLHAVVRELVSAFRHAIIAITVLSLAGATLRGAVLAGGLYYLHLLESNATLAVTDFHFAARDPSVLTSVTVLLVTLLIASGGLLYAARRVTARMIERYQRYQVVRIIRTRPSVLADLPPPRSAEDAAARIARVVIRDAHQSAMLVRVLGRCLPALVTIAYAIPVILYIDPVTTGLLALLLLLAMPLFYMTNVMAYESSLLVRRVAQDASRQLYQCVEHFQYAGTAVLSEEVVARRSVLAGALQHRLAALPMYLQALARTDFLVNVLMGVGLGLVLLFQVPGALHGYMDWTRIVAYFVFLRIAVEGAGALLGFLNIFSKLYPSTRRYQEYVAKRVESERRAAPLEIRAATRTLAEVGATSAVAPGTVLTVWSRLSPTRFTLPYLLGSDFDVDSGLVASTDDVTIVPPEGVACETESLADLFSFDAANGTLRVLPAVANDEFKQCFGAAYAVGAQFDRRDRLLLSRGQRVEIGVLAACRCPARVVVLAASTLAAVSAQLRAELLERLREAGKVVVVVYVERLCRESLGIASALSGPESPTCALGLRGDVLAYGSTSWLQTHLHRVRVAMREDGARSREAVPDDFSATQDEEYLS